MSLSSFSIRQANMVMQVGCLEEYNKWKEAINSFLKRLDSGAPRTFS